MRRAAWASWRCCACVFAVVGPVTALVSLDQRPAFFASALRWGPSAASIAAALVVAASSRWRRFSPTTVLTLGLVFEVVGSYGIAAARYLDPQQGATTPPGVSWVAVWILLFAAMIPSRPRHTLAAGLGSATAVPAMTSVGAALGGGSPSVGLAVRTLVPYLLVVATAYVTSRMVYRLGTKLTHARELGSYRLVERLGAGGMGEVWRAEHHLLARPAAIKLIRQADGDPNHHATADVRARFEREAQVTASLRSPHTIQLYDFGVTDDGTFYYVMELLEGFDLQALVEQFGPVPIERAVAFLWQVCHSLAEAHDRGLIHRDIKPANVYACRYGRELDFIKVLDFGLVKPLNREQEPTQLSLSGVHGVRGTPAFMAPEQALGDRPVDARSDLYAVGCLAYWLVTGKQVFQGDTPLEVIVRHVQVSPDPPSHHAEEAIPQAFDQLVLACLSKNPDDRPADADAVAAQLRLLALEEPWTQDRARRWWARHAPAKP
jgi:eukaryotic-like serine/threonine-protein kinase